MNEAPLQIACPHCDALNRVPPSRLGESPRCGRCRQPLFAGSPIDLDEARFDTHARRGDVPLLVDFWAAWCGPCRQMAPFYAAAAAKLEPQVRLAKVDVDAAPRLSSRFSIASIPTLVLLHHGRELARRSGAAAGVSDIVHWVQAQLPHA